MTLLQCPHMLGGARHDGHACNFSTGEAEAGELNVGSQPGLYSEISSQNQRAKKEKEALISFLGTLP